MSDPKNFPGGGGGILGGIFNTQYLPAAMIAFSSGLKAIGTVQQGNAMVEAAQRRQQAANFEAEQLRVNAGQALAASQRDAYWEGKKGELLASALRARLGSGASDPTGLSLLADITQRMAYNKQMLLYGGKDKARLMEMQAKSRQYDAALGLEDAKAGRKSSYLAAAGTIASGAASLYEKYWPKDRVDMVDDDANVLTADDEEFAYYARGPVNTTGIRG
jgi:hypothetical protein